MEVLHIPCYSTKDPIPTLEKNLAKLKDYSKVVIVGTAQHMNTLDGISEFLSSHGFTPVIGGQVLGCKQDAAITSDADCILYVGSGRFHPLGIADKTDIPVFILNPLSQVLDLVDQSELERMRKKRKGAITKALVSKTFGIMVSTKDGQYKLDDALRIKKQIQSKSKKAYLFVGDHVSPDNMLGFKVDCLINTACKRIEDDQYQVPVIDFKDFEEYVLGNL